CGKAEDYDADLYRKRCFVKGVNGLDCIAGGDRRRRLRHELPERRVTLFQAPCVILLKGAWKDLLHDEAQESWRLLGVYGFGFHARSPGTGERRCGHRLRRHFIRFRLNVNPYSLARASSRVNVFW